METQTKTSKKKKLLMAVLSVCVIAALAIGGSLAFLTDSEKTVNTFTVGDLDIKLDETKWDDSVDGKEMLSGDTYDKNPTVTEISNDSYMRMYVQIVDTDTGEQIKDTNRLKLILDTIRFDGTGTGLVEGNKYTLDQLKAYKMVDESKFVKDETRSEDGKYCYNFNGVLSEGSTATLFTTIAIPSDYNQDQIGVVGKFKVVVSAEAIQSKGFTGATDAYAALDAEVAADSIEFEYGTTGVGGVRS